MKNHAMTVAAAFASLAVQANASESANPTDASMEISPVPAALSMSKNAMVLQLLGTAGGPLSRSDRSQPANLLMVDGAA